MLLWLFLLFTCIPLLELALLFEVAKRTSFGATILLVILTGSIGAYLARREGIRALQRIQDAASRSESPTSAMWDAVLILIAGVVLITPGILTDFLGFSLLLPPVRRLLGNGLSRWLQRRMVHARETGHGGNGVWFYTANFSSTDPGSGPDGDTFVDVQATSHEKVKRTTLEIGSDDQNANER
ncbi:MAG: FxsA family protein [Phycisphaerae bacterium]